MSFFKNTLFLPADLRNVGFKNTLFLPADLRNVGSTIPEIVTIVPKIYRYEKQRDMKLRSISESDFHQIDGSRQVIADEHPRRFAALDLDETQRIYGLSWNSELIEPEIALSADGQQSLLNRIPVLLRNKHSIAPLLGN